MVIASISKQVVDDINTGNRGIYGSVIKEIRLRASHFMCSFTYESRDLNVEAYNLAKLGHSLGPGRHVSLGHFHDSRCISNNETCLELNAWLLGIKCALLEMQVVWVLKTFAHKIFVYC